MIRVTFELLPGGREEGRRVIGLMEIANMRTGADNVADYGVVLKKCPPFHGALRETWRKVRVAADAGTEGLFEDGPEEMIAAACGHHRTRRGIYDLAFRALRACGLQERNR